MESEGIEVKMTPPHPGAFLRTEIVQDLGLSVDEVAQILGVDSIVLSEVLSCQSSPCHPNWPFG